MLARWSVGKRRSIVGSASRPSRHANGCSLATYAPKPMCHVSWYAFDVMLRRRASPLCVAVPCIQWEWEPPGLPFFASVRVDEEPSDFRTVAEECPCAHYKQYLSIQFKKALT